MAEGHAFQVSHVSLPQPPEHLLTYDYCRVKALKCIRSLKSNKVDNIQTWEAKLKGHILCIHRTGTKTESFLKDIFKCKVDLEKSDTPSMEQTTNINESADVKPTTNLFSERMVIVFVETTRDTDENVSFSEETKHQLEYMRTHLSTKDLQRVTYFVDQTPPNEVTKMTQKIQESLQMKPDKSVTVYSRSDNEQTIQCRLYILINKIIDGMEKVVKPQKVELERSLMEPEKLQAIVKASDTFANLKRNMGSQKKENVMSGELRSLFENMTDKGYTGHVFLNQKLTIYFREGSKQQDIATLVKSGEMEFDNVCHQIVKDDGTIKQFASIKPDTRVENTRGQCGRIGAFAKLQPDNAVVGLSVAHVSKSGESLKDCDGSIIGECIWPAGDDTNATSLQNEISVIKMQQAMENECSMKHDNLRCEARPILVNDAIPTRYSLVYKGNGILGFTKGRIISTEARLPLGSNLVEAYLIEADEDETVDTPLPFAQMGDCGSLTKLQMEEESGKLKAISMVFGGVLALPDIEEDTCITIPLHSAVRRFEHATQKTVSFQ